MTLTRWFLEQGANLNAFGKPGPNILDIAAANSTPAVFDLLLKHVAKLEDSNALQSAAGELEKVPGRVEMMRHLLGMGMEINALWRRVFPPGRRIGRATPLHAAASSQQHYKILLLLEKEADPGAEKSLCQTPLEYAIRKDLTTSIEVFKKCSSSEQV